MTCEVLLNDFLGCVDVAVLSSYLLGVVHQSGLGVYFLILHYFCNFLS